MMKRYSHHTFSVQSPHTMDAILFRDVKIRNCGYRPLRYTKIWLARDIISYNGTMFSRVLYYIVNFEIIALDK